MLLYCAQNLALMINSHLNPNPETADMSCSMEHQGIKPKKPMRGTCIVLARLRRCILAVRLTQRSKCDSINSNMPLESSPSLSNRNELGYRVVKMKAY